MTMFFIRTNPNRTGQYMSLTRVGPNHFLILRDNTDIVFYPRVILNRIRAGQPIGVLKAHLRTFAQLQQNIRSITRNYTEVPNVPQTVNRRRRFSRN